MSTLITQYTGTTLPIKITIKNADGSAVDITGATFRLTIRETADSDNALVSVVQTALTDPTNGITLIEIHAALTDDFDSKTALFDIQYESAEGNVSTIQYGIWTFIKSITQ